MYVYVDVMSAEMRTEYKLAKRTVEETEGVNKEEERANSDFLTGNRVRNRKIGIRETRFLLFSRNPKGER